VPATQLQLLGYQAQPIRCWIQLQAAGLDEQIQGPGRNFSGKTHVQLARALLVIFRWQYRI
jgi:hypothetical protein